MPDGIRIDRWRCLSGRAILAQFFSRVSIFFASTCINNCILYRILCHITDTAIGLRSCVVLLNSKTLFLQYLSFVLENHLPASRLLWRCSDALRYLISRNLAGNKYLVSDALAPGVYFRLVSAALLAERMPLCVEHVSLSYYIDQSFYTKRTDALDRFVTLLEWRFTQKEIRSMIDGSRLNQIPFLNRSHYWGKVGIKR